MRTAIRTEGLTKRYGEVDALKDLDLEVAEGEVVGCLGPNGAGKTTTIRLLLGLFRPTAGAPRSSDSTATARPSRRTVAWPTWPGEANLWPSLTGAETLHLLGRVQGAVDDRLPRRADRRASTSTRSKKVRAYSKGNRQKLVLIAALMTRRRPAPARRADQRARPADGAGLPPLRPRGAGSAARPSSCRRTS